MVGIIARDCSETPNLAVFLSMGLNRPNPVEVFLDEFRKRREAFLDLERLVIEPSRNQVARARYERHHWQKPKCELWRKRDHEREGGQPRETQDDHRATSDADHLAHEVEVVDGTRHQIACGITGKKAW